MDLVVTARDLSGLGLLDTSDVAAELDVSPSRVVQLEREGHLPAARTASGRRVFILSDVRALKQRRAAVAQ